MPSGKMLLVLLKTAIFTAIVPYAVGLWLKTQVQGAFRESPHSYRTRAVEDNFEPAAIIKLMRNAF